MQTRFVLNVIGGTLLPHFAVAHLRARAQPRPGRRNGVIQGKPPATCTSLRKRSSSQGPCFQVVLGQWLLLKRIWKIRRKEKPTRKSGVLKMDKQARYEHLNNSHRKWSYFITAHCRARGLALCALVSSSVKQWFGWGEDLNYTLQGFLTFFFFSLQLICWLCLWLVLSEADPEHKLLILEV